MASYRPRNFKLADDYSFPGDPALEIRPYIFPETAVIAVDVALATSRPLLIAGPPGCGKSRLAEAMAAVLGWNFLSKTITSRTRLEELTVEVDHLRRLHDAHRAARPDAVDLKPDQAYHNPGSLLVGFRPGVSRTPWTQRCRRRRIRRHLALSR
jgi:MoxR-like ATPase